MTDSTTTAPDPLDDGTPRRDAPRGGSRGICRNRTHGSEGPGFPWLPRAAAAVALLVVAACGRGAGPAPEEAAAPEGPRRVSVPAVQGAGHASPLLGRTVAVTGIVTAVTPSDLYVQDPEGDGRAATSDAMLVARGDETEARVGDRVAVTGRVAEPVPGGEGTANLTRTRLQEARVEVLASGRELPPPVRLGSGGRTPPAVEVIGAEELPVDLSDPEQAAANEFDPASEGIDFWESLEGMRVTVGDPVAVGPTATFDDGGASVFTLAEDGAYVRPEDARTARGGIRLQPHPGNRGDQNPERVLLRFDPGLYPADPPTLRVGDRLGEATGVVDYAFGNFGVRVTDELPSWPGGLTHETTGLSGSAAAVTVATYNVLNLNPLPENAARMARLGEQIAAGLGAPDVVALQEVQDENGTTGGKGNRETDATATLRALVEAVRAAGGPAYEFVDVAPSPNSSGGVPGGNIRNAFLWNPERVELVEAVSLTAERLSAAGAPDPEAFRGARDPLAATFTYDGARFTVVNNHFTSRSGSTPIFGAVQPFVQAGEEQREAQARTVHAWVQRRLEEAPSARVAVVGDLNTYEFTDDLTELLPAGTAREDKAAGRDGAGGRILHNLMLDVPVGRRHTYVFEGNSQTLDHVFVTRRWRTGAKADPVHLNAEFPVAADRTSDHDPVVARLPLEPGS